MAADSRDHVKKMDPDEILCFLREHDDPALTASEVAGEFDVTPSAARYRLGQLEEEGRVRGKKVGASSKIWYPVG